MKTLRNPITGQEYTEEITDYGKSQVPHQSCSLSMNGIGGAGFIFLGQKRQDADSLAIYLKDSAKGISEMTGKEVDFWYEPDDHSQWMGYFGRFIVNKPKLANEEI